MADKNLRIKVQVDSSGLATISKEFDNISAKVEQTTKKTDALTVAKERYADLATKVGKANAYLQEQTVGLNKKVEDGIISQGLAWGAAQASYKKYLSLIGNGTLLAELEKAEKKLKEIANATSLGATSANKNQRGSTSTVSGTVGGNREKADAERAASLELYYKYVKEQADKHLAEEKRRLTEETTATKAALAERQAAWEKLFTNIKHNSRLISGMSEAGKDKLANPNSFYKGQISAGLSAQGAVEYARIKEKERQQVIKESNDRIQQLNEATEAHYKRLKEKRAFEEQSEANRRLLLYTNLFNQIEEKEKQYFDNKKALAEHEARLEAQLLDQQKFHEQSNLNARLHAYNELFRQIEEREARIASIAARKKAIRTNIANIYKQETNEILAELDRRTALEHAKRVFGANDSRTLELKAAQEQIRIKEDLVKKLAALESQIRAGTVSSGNARNQRQAALAQAEAALHAADSINRLGQAHRSLGFRILEIIGIYRIFNSTLNQISSAIRAIPQIGINLEATKAVLATTTSSIQGAASYLAQLDTEAKRTGISVNALRESFRVFSASTSLAGETMTTTWKIFQNMNTVITALHLSGDQANHIFLALAQIFNKSKIQSEELVKQLGNLLPGAFASMAKALGKTPRVLAEEMKKGLVFAHENVLAFSETLAEDFQVAFALATNGLQFSIGTMQTSFTHLGESIYDLTGGALRSFIYTTAEVTDYLAATVRGTTGLARFFRIAIPSAIQASILALGLFAASYRKAAMTAAAPTILQSIFAIRTGADLAALASRGLEGALAFLKSPFALIAGLSALVGYFYSLRGEIDKNNTAAKEMIDLANQAREQAEKSKTRGGFIEVGIENDPTVKKIKDNIASLKKDKAELENISLLPDMSPEGVLQRQLHPLQSLDRYAKDLVKVWDGTAKSIEEKSKLIIEQEKNLAAATADARVRLEKDFESVDPINALTRERHELEMAKRRALGDDAGAAVLQTQKRFETLAKQADDIISSYDDKMTALLTKQKELRVHIAKETDEGVKSALLGTDVQIHASIKELEERHKQAIADKENIKLVIEDAGKKAEIKADKLESRGLKKEATADYNEISDMLDIALQEHENYITDLEGKYKNHTISMETFFKEKSGTVARELETKRVFYEELANEARYYGDTYRAKGYIRDSQKAYAEAEGKIKQIMADKTKATEEFSFLLDKINSDYRAMLAVSGQSADVIDLETTRKNLAIRKELQITIKDGTEEQRKQAELALQQFEATQKYSRELKAVKITEEGLSKAKEASDAKLYELKIKQDVGLITELQARTQIQEVVENQANLEIKTYESLLKQAETNQANYQIISAIIAKLEEAKAKGLTNLAFTLPRSEARGQQGDNASLFGSISTDGSIALKRQEQYAKERDERLARENYEKSNTFVGPQEQGSIFKISADTEYTLKSTALYTEYFANLASLGANAAMSIYEANAKMYGAQSKEAKKAFMLYRAVKIGEIIMSTASAVMQAFAQGGPYLGPALAGIAIATGAIQLATVSSQQPPAAHGGLDFVPKEETYLLDKGERVLSPKQNRDLTKALAEGNIGSKQGSSQNIRIINAVDPSLFNEYLGSDEGEKVIMNIIKRNQG